VDEIVTVTDREVAWAIALLLERTKLLVEGAGAVGLAALLSGRVRAAGKTVAVVLSGGNIDPVLLGRILDHGLARQGRFVLLNIILPDAPGGLSRVLRLVADAGANVVDIVHHRHGPEVLLGRVRVEILAETGDQEHVARLTKQIRSAGFDLLDP
jgi:threonine dehydratase